MITLLYLHCFIYYIPSLFKIAFYLIYIFRDLFLAHIIRITFVNTFEVVIACHVFTSYLDYFTGCNPFLILL